MAASRGPVADEDGAVAGERPPRGRDVGLKIGLEIHQQLDTRKLFCGCPTRLDEESDLVFHRLLRPTASELGEVDPAAVAEARRKLSFDYQSSGATACLVEMDEEPPHSIQRESVDAALEIALLLRMRPVDEIHVMRKIVIDGSNTSGFQRTALLAMDGAVESSEGRVGIATLCLEEDAARRMGESEGKVVYRLDRLGIPLVEIATAPDIRSPAGAREVAEAIGLALRSTGKVKRGIGTIRQDLNVSIRGGARVEIKGVQELRLLAPAVEWEVRRQEHLLAVRDALALRGGSDADVARPLEDLSARFAATTSKVLKPVLARGGLVLALPLPKFGGLLRSANGDADGPRLGRELADAAKVAAGVKGIFHSDELPGYGIEAREVAGVREALSLQSEEDAFVLVAADSEIAHRALEAVRERARRALVGVPEETRDVLEDGSTRYLRPLPGGARMYPETDVPPLTLPPDAIEAVRAKLPELLSDKAKRFAREFGLSDEEARTIARSSSARLYEELAREGQAREAARALVHVVPELEREGLDVQDDVLRAAFARLRAGEFAKEALPDVLRAVAKGATFAAALERLGLDGAGPDLEREIERALDERADLVRDRGLAAAKPLMGVLMARLKGRVSGEELSRLLEKKIRERTS